MLSEAAEHSAAAESKHPYGQQVLTIGVLRLARHTAPRSLRMTAELDAD